MARPTIEGFFFRAALIEHAALVAKLNRLSTCD